MNDPLVTIICLVYNHEPYLRQCLDGFAMQKTNFKFEAIVHDDASTDNSAAIIKEYADRYPNIIKPIYEIENHYSRHDGSIPRIINKVIAPSAKYIAICEGDDYWIDPLKLQKQVNYLETHIDCSMCCNRTLLYSEKRKNYIGESYCEDFSTILKTEDVINRTGLFISTCSIVYRKDITDNYPEYCIKCPVGDYPLQIMAAMKGYIYYFNEIMSAYRVENSNSWMNSQKWLSSSDYNLKRIDLMINMFEGFMSDNLKYRNIFNNKIAEYIRSSLPYRIHNEEEYKKFNEHFKDKVSNFSLSWKIDYWLLSRLLPRFLIKYYKHSNFAIKKYKKRILLYK